MVVEAGAGLTTVPVPRRVQARRVTAVSGRKAVAWFRAVPFLVYRSDPNWTPPLPGEEEEAFNPRRTPSIRDDRARRWVLLEDGLPIGRVAAFLPARHPGVGYFGFFECPDDPAAAIQLLRTAEQWLVERGCHECYGPIAGTPRDRIGLLTEGFDRPALLFTPYNPPYYGRLIEAAGYAPRVLLRGFGWAPDFRDRLEVLEGGHQPERDATIRIRQIRPNRLAEDTRVIATLVNETMADAWHYDPIDEREADQMARLLRPIIDPRVALIAEDETGPCAVALTVPDVNWLWRKAGGRLLPTGWLELLRWRRRIPTVRMMALGVSRRIRGSSVARRMIARVHEGGVAAGFAHGELTQVFDSNRTMRRILERMGFPVVRRYAVFHRSLEG
jgi:hypothetical protein